MLYNLFVFIKNNMELPKYRSHNLMVSILIYVVNLKPLLHVSLTLLYKIKCFIIAPKEAALCKISQWNKYFNRFVLVHGRRHFKRHEKFVSLHLYALRERKVMIWRMSAEHTLLTHSLTEMHC